MIDLSQSPSVHSVRVQLALRLLLLRSAAGQIVRVLQSQRDGTRTRTRETMMFDHEKLDVYRIVAMLTKMAAISMELREENEYEYVNQANRQQPHSTND